jgi:lipopolysaccharide export system permease protein
MKTYIKFIINLFNTSLLKVFIIFFFIILISNVLEQVEFFKKIDIDFFYLLFLSFLNTPNVVFEILPFIFLLSTQIFFIQLMDKNELEIFKYSGLNNIKIMKVLGIYSFILGLIFITFFYNISSVLKSSYLLIKNGYSADDKYLAVITKNGIWIKDEINDSINIINAERLEDEFLIDVSITKFNKNYDILEILQSKKVNITSKKWTLFNPILSKKNSQSTLSKIILESNFDIKRINSLFSNLSSLSIIDLINLRNSYVSLNYSVTDIDSHLLKIATYPIYLTLVTIFSAIIMFNIGYQKNTFFKIMFGILLSVVIYYINNFLSVLGTNEKIPLVLSIFLPLILLSILNFISIIKLNEK